MPTPEINNREGYSRVLAATIAEIDGFASREPAYWVWGNLQQQLHAMRDWTADGAEPTAEQAQRISVGLVAARELEPPADAAMDDLITRLHLLSYFWRHEFMVPIATATHKFKAPRTPFMSNTVLIASIVLFIVACCLPALEFKNSQGPNDVMLGLRALVVGWSGFFAAVFAWFANPCWLLGVILLSLRKPISGGVLGLIAVAIACSTFKTVGIELPGDEGNVTRTTIIRLLPGFYVWIASLLSLPLAALLSLFRS